MSEPFAIPYNTTPTEPSLADLLNQMKKDVLYDMNCHHIGTIQAFDPEKQTAQATINYKRTIFEIGTDRTYVPKLVDFPVLLDCPVIFLFGANGGLTVPVKQGDACIILFNDRDMDNWYEGQVPGSVASPRLHSFADGIILVGPRSMTKVLQNFDPDRPSLRNFDGSTGVSVGETMIKLYNENFTLRQLLQELVDNVKTLVSQTAAITVFVATAPGTSGPPLNAAAIAAVSADLDSTMADIEDLLE